MGSRSYLRYVLFDLIRARPRPRRFNLDGAGLDALFCTLSRPRLTPSAVRFYSLWRNNQLFGYVPSLGNNINSNILITLRSYHSSPFSMSRRNDDSIDAVMEREFKKNLENLDYEDKNPKEVLEKISRDQYKRQKAMRYNRIRKQFPQTKESRLLTTDMMEQIRFLFQEHPEDWNVSRLAEGFSVTEDTIRKVLRSKFVPNDKTIAKQNNVALKNRSLLINDARRVFVDTKNFLPGGMARLPAAKELKPDSLEDGIRRPSAKYLNEGERIQRKRYKTYKKSVSRKKD